ncbi:MAG TPA: S41 family peptidase [Isosphaeraceae bacterium]|nr:S41 family peptidase [Isosphaeraceae bacterium]
MRRLLSPCLAVWFLFWAAGTPVPGAWGEPPSTPVAAPVPSASPAPPEDPSALLDRGLDQERARNWSAAIEVYREALERWPSRVEFSRRLRLCEIHFKLHRRYADTSFRQVLLPIPLSQATELYDEVLERIQNNYVDSVTLEPLVRHGLDNLEVALRDPVFLQTNAPGAAPERVTWLRDTLRQYRANLVIPDRAAAVRMAVACCELARQAIGMAGSPVLLEFTCGACDALDDFTSYLTPDKLEDLYAMIDGNFVGLGIELKVDKAGLRLIGVIRGGPAWEAGLQPGDVIVEISGRSIQGLALDEAANRLQGAEGSTVDLVLRRRDGTSQSFRLVRRHVDVESVTKVKVVDPAAGIGYLRLSGFQKTSTEELDQAIAALSRQNMTVLVIDLRGNPGGLLNVAVEIAERFLDAGLIVSTRGRAQGQTQMLAANGRARWRMPLYILVDHDSASASEILAGALQDHRRATIVGARTYGKGSVQSIFSLRSAPAGLKLTTAKFYSPLNRPYSEQGVQPDVPVQSRTAARPADETALLREEANFGDPAKDPVLAAAIRTAMSRSRSSR